ncbi:MAG: hypothetical protein A3G39_09585 [Deltaproteobacteria bacterium RIFCSPLOWO2_12_FULL_43_16]|nr:MAG: hypothetical protein A3D30_03050 [Deltaproteobacteria bacterium RIFCSPHIGHO2_02_FULL_43_33]OGQ39834.1 MAG: hypothetical protein A3A85_04445 [Deltaproteobacteria bacterium RIFCSPLOWO2_01_FULL_42_9]OGQ59119.1 MAG: hypothetical protein A3G39_09585 [Deltaproteobacteria bacterium RIFCSPLOWO2_12_FULL_43_16]HBR16002.1 hypothetical protein [Deltaproteobacteria bacterium]
MIKIIAAVLSICFFNGNLSYAEKSSKGDEKAIEISPKTMKQGAKKVVEKTEKGLNKAVEKTEEGIKKAGEKTGKALEKAGKKVKEHIAIEKDE